MPRRRRRWRGRPDGRDVERVIPHEEGPNSSAPPYAPKPEPVVVPMGALQTSMQTVPIWSGTPRRVAAAGSTTIPIAHEIHTATNAPSTGRRRRTRPPSDPPTSAAGITAAREAASPTPRPPGPSGHPGLPVLRWQRERPGHDRRGQDRQAEGQHHRRVRLGRSALSRPGVVARRCPGRERRIVRAPCCRSWPHVRRRARTCRVPVGGFPGSTPPLAPRVTDRRASG